MVGYVDILKAVTGVLTTNFKGVKVYGDEVVEGYKTPSFFINILPVSSETETKNNVRTEMLVVVNYFSKTTNSLENLKFMDSLRKAFGIVLKVGQRRFTIKNCEIEKGEDIGVYNLLFSISYFENINFEEEPEAMGELILNNERVK